jgi:hypothetical protein
MDSKMDKTSRKVNFYTKQIVEINFLPILGSMSDAFYIIDLPSLDTVRIVLSPAEAVASQHAPHADTTGSQRS